MLVLVCRQYPSRNQLGSDDRHHLGERRPVREGDPQTIPRRCRGTRQPLAQVAKPVVEAAAQAQLGPDVAAGIAGTVEAGHDFELAPVAALLRLVPGSQREASLQRRPRATCSGVGRPLGAMLGSPPGRPVDAHPDGSRDNAIAVASMAGVSIRCTGASL